MFQKFARAQAAFASTIWNMVLNALLKYWQEYREACIRAADLPVALSSQKHLATTDLPHDQIPLCRR